MASCGCRVSRLHRSINRRKWDVVRLLVLERDNYRCQVCGLLPGRAEVDHVIPLHRSGAPLDPDNLQVLCRDCHFTKTRTELQIPDPARDRWRALVASIK